MDVLEYLRDKHVDFKRASPTEVHTACWWCGEDPSKRGRLYINVDPNASPPGLFECKMCGESGAFNKIRKHYGDDALDDDGNPFVKGDKGPPPTSGIVFEILREAADYYYRCLCEATDPYLWLLDERGITVDTIHKHKIGWAPGGLKQHLLDLKFPLKDILASHLVTDRGDFYVNRITIPYTANGQVIQIRGKDINGKYTTPPGDTVRLFNVDATFQASTVIVCEGEFDALVLEQLGYNAVGMPGAQAWQPAWNSYLTNASRVYACFDRDEAGAKGYEKLLKNVGPKLKQILMPEHGLGENKNDPSEWLGKKGHTKEEFQALVDAANPSMLITVDQAYEEWLQVEGNAHRIRVGFGWSSIDSDIGGGMAPGQVAVFLAKTGVGKTLALTNIFHNLLKNPDHRVLFFSLEQTRNEWLDRAWKIFRFHNEKLGSLPIPIGKVLDYYRNRFLLIDRNRVQEEEVREAIEEFTIQLGKPTMIAVDYLGYWARAYKGDGYERTTEAIMKMKEISKDVKIPFVTPHQVNRAANGQSLDISSARDSGAVEETADFVIAMNEDLKQRGTVERPEWESTGNIILDIKKSRHGGAGRKNYFVRTPLTLALVSDKDPAIRDAREEVEAYGNVQQLPEYMLRRRTGVVDPGPRGIAKAAQMEAQRELDQAVANGVC